MVEEKEFLSLEELTKQTHEFKKRWYGLTGRATNLSNFKSGFDEGFKGAIKSIYDDIEVSKDYIDGFEHQLKHYFPEHRSDVTWLTKKVFRHLEDLRVIAKKDADILENSKDLSQNLKSYTEELNQSETKLKEAEEKSGDACRKYFDMKNEYTTEYQTLDDKIQKQMTKIQDKFVEMTTPIVEGHDIAFGTSTLSIAELFEQLSEKPGDVEKINLVVRKGGIFGKRSETDVAKTSVLKYVSGEILEGVPPIQKEKGKLVEQLKSKYLELPKLEKLCEASEQERKKLEKPVSALREKIAEIKKSEVFKFADYDGILETREQYLDKIGEVEKDVKSYLDFALLNLKGFVELESDVEKRNLLTEVKSAKEKSIAMEKDASKAKEELTVKIKELTTMTALKEGLEKKLKSTIEKQKTAEKQTLEMKKRNEKINKQINEFKAETQSNLKKFKADVETKISQIASSIETPEKKGSEEHEVEEKMDRLRGKKK